MSTTQSQPDFADVLKNYVASEHAYKKYIAFLQSRTFEELSDWIPTYFEVTRNCDDADPRSLIAFRDLIARMLSKGDQYFALRFDAIAHKRDTPWQRRYAALDASGRQQLDAEIERQRAHLSLTQRTFLDKFTRHLTQPGIAEIEGFVEGLTQAQQLQDCLLAYIEASLTADDTDQRSLKVFYRLSLRALARCGTDFAAQYEARVHAPGSVWKRRYDALESWQRDTVLAPTIMDRRQKLVATVHDFASRRDAGPQRARNGGRPNR